MGARVIDGVVYDTGAATLVATFPRVWFDDDGKRFLYASPNNEKRTSSEVYSTQQGTWFVVTHHCCPR